jgi:hypothetical protein
MGGFDHHMAATEAPECCQGAVQSPPPPLPRDWIEHDQHTKLISADDDILWSIRSYFPYKCIGSESRLHDMYFAAGRLFEVARFH